MTDEPADDVAVMVVRLWEHGGALAELVKRMQEHERRAQALAREALELRLELTDLLHRMYIGGVPSPGFEASADSVRTDAHPTAPPVSGCPSQRGI
jgi:hypothetical protein